MKRMFYFMLAISCSASWAKWEATTVSSDMESVFYHDKSTIRRNGSIVKMWSMVDFNSVQNKFSDGKFYKSFKVLRVFDCRSEMTATSSIARYSESFGGGSVVSIENWKDDELIWYATVPDSVQELEWKLACSKRR